MGNTENTNTEGVTIVHVSSDTNVQMLAGSLLTAIEEVMLRVKDVTCI